MLLLLIIECNYNDFFVGFLAKMKVLSRWIEVSTERWKNPQKTTIFTTISSQRQSSYTFFNGNITFSLKTDYLRGTFALCCNTIQCVGYLDLMEVHYNSCFCSLTHWPIGTLAHRHWFTFRNSANETHWTEEREREWEIYVQRTALRFIAILAQLQFFGSSCSGWFVYAWHRPWPWSMYTISHNCLGPIFCNRF